MNLDICRKCKRCFSPFEDCSRKGKYKFVCFEEGNYGDTNRNIAELTEYEYDVLYSKPHRIFPIYSIRELYQFGIMDKIQVNKNCPYYTEHLFIENEY